MFASKCIVNPLRLIGQGARYGDEGAFDEATAMDEFSNAFLQNFLLRRSVVTQSMFTSLVQRL
jgi:hypothetical protein